MPQTNSKRAKGRGHLVDGLLIGRSRQHGASNQDGDGDGNGDADSDKAAALRLIEAHDTEVEQRRSRDAAAHVQGPPRGLRAGDGSLGVPLGPDAAGAGAPVSIPSPDEYEEWRKEVVSREEELSFDARCRSRATPQEERVDCILRKMRRRDDARVYAREAPRKGYRGQLHPRFAGDHFLGNIDLINETALFKMASKMPKGAHLHIHFNACLPPKVLLDIAKGMDRMFITSSLPLVRKAEVEGEDGYENFHKCEIQFSIMSVEKEREDPGDLFSADYRPRQAMKFSDFLRRFPHVYTLATADEWLLHKLMFEEMEAHHPYQTASG